MRRVLMSVVVVVLSLVAAPSAPAADSYFATVGGLLNTGRMYADAAPLPGGKALVVGGFSGITEPLTAEVYDPATDQFTLTTTGPGGARTAPALAPLPDGRVLVAGGQAGPSYLDTATIFDPVGGTFGGLAATLTTARSGAVAAPLPDGTVLIAGGVVGFTTLQSAEIFDPATESFSGIPATLSLPRGDAAAAALEDGRVLIVGGSGADGSASSAEIYDPVAGTFSGLPAMTGPRTNAGAALLGNGRVLVAGGSGAGGGALAELFDPVTGTFTPTPTAMTIARDAPVAAPLADGTALISGGYPGSGPTVLRSAERFVSAPEARITGAQPFGAVDVGAVAPTRTVTIRNVGSQGLTIGTGLTLSGDDPTDFAVSDNTCAGATLAFKATCSLKVTFTPSADGARTARIELATNEPSSSAVKLSGTGVGSAPTKAPGTAVPVAPPSQTPAGTTKTTGVPASRVTCTAKRKRGRTRITCTVKLSKPRAAKATLRRGTKILARGRVTKGGRVTLTTALKPRAGTYTLRIGATRITVRLR